MLTLSLTPGLWVTAPLISRGPHTLALCDCRVEGNLALGVALSPMACPHLVMGSVLGLPRPPSCASAWGLCLPYPQPGWLGTVPLLPPGPPGEGAPAPCVGYSAVHTHLLPQASRGLLRRFALLTAVSGTCRVTSAPEAAGWPHCWGSASCHQ